MVNTQKENFDRKAASWDEDPTKIKLTNDVFHALSREGILTPEMDVMDFGCGTGLLTIRLRPLVRSITGLDNSRGMLEVFNAKIASLGLDGIHAAPFDLDEGHALSGRYDLVLSCMTLHHIEEIGPLLRQFHRVIAPGGCLAIADLDPDDGLFHSDNTGIFHFGFSRTALRGVFAEAGFQDIRDTDAAEVPRPGPDGAIRRFSVFLMTGKKET
uniref:Methyltransferase domain-containing protein n=1 Tax=Candidatus Kentrum sp. SD TaxID=2126332 RepID=A0A451BPB7_9GAMM|nr:MAG: Methyltransferase domain-containing protein [Candidatus Kentron sp. SD]VFK46614.1 MAG: Methyltransferase domain-containing protein [Candidatus Kentron sp. SD]VFK80098.1 MAG: Methyltransferase domain-containing protein [Candidatus Kentron sp. SD]